VALAVLMPLLVALSRLYRGEHHPTDIAGGVLLAVAWLAATVLFVRPNTDVPAEAVDREVARRRDVEATTTPARV
jgi:undecaprenyl-diphosphatase